MSETKGRQGRLLLRPLEESVPRVLSSFGCFLAIFGISWRVEASSSSLPSSSHRVFLVSRAVSKFPHSVRTPVDYDPS